MIYGGLTPSLCKSDPLKIGVLVYGKRVRISQPPQFNIKNIFENYSIFSSINIFILKELICYKIEKIFI